MDGVEDGIGEVTILGEVDGSPLGSTVGFCNGTELGDMLWSMEGNSDGLVLGKVLSALEGSAESSTDGCGDSRDEGFAVGKALGIPVGLPDDSDIVGTKLGPELGATESIPVGDVEVVEDGVSEDSTLGKKDGPSLGWEVGSEGNIVGS